jgi:hypothetical protein
MGPRTKGLSEAGSPSEIRTVARTEHAGGARAKYRLALCVLRAILAHPAIGPAIAGVAGGRAAEAGVAEAGGAGHILCTAAADGGVSRTAATGVMGFAALLPPLPGADARAALTFPFAYPANVQAAEFVGLRFFLALSLFPGVHEIRKQRDAEPRTEDAAQDITAAREAGQDAWESRNAMLVHGLPSLSRPDRHGRSDEPRTMPPSWQYEPAWTSSELCSWTM